MNWAFDAPKDRGSAEHNAAQLGSQRRSGSAQTRTVWTIIALLFTCGLVAAIVAMSLAVFVLHLA
jgi:hypothetical protein